MSSVLTYEIWNELLIYNEVMQVCGWQCGWQWCIYLVGSVVGSLLSFHIGGS